MGERLRVRQARTRRRSLGPGHNRNDRAPAGYCAASGRKMRQAGGKDYPIVGTISAGWRSTRIPNLPYPLMVPVFTSLAAP